MSETKYDVIRIMQRLSVFQISLSKVRNKHQGSVFPFVYNLH